MVRNIANRDVGTFWLNICWFLIWSDCCCLCVSLLTEADFVYIFVRDLLFWPLFITTFDFSLYESTRPLFSSWWVFAEINFISISNDALVFWFVTDAVSRKKNKSLLIWSLMDEERMMLFLLPHPLPIFGIIDGDQRVSAWPFGFVFWRQTVCIRPWSPLPIWNSLWSLWIGSMIIEMRMRPIYFATLWFSALLRICSPRSFAICSVLSFVSDIAHVFL